MEYLKPIQGFYRVHKSLSQQMKCGLPERTPFIPESHVFLTFFISFLLVTSDYHCGTKCLEYWVFVNRFLEAGFFVNDYKSRDSSLHCRKMQTKISNLQNKVGSSVEILHWCESLLLAKSALLFAFMFLLIKSIIIRFPCKTVRPQLLADDLLVNRQATDATVITGGSSSLLIFKATADRQSPLVMKN